MRKLITIILLAIISISSFGYALYNSIRISCGYDWKNQNFRKALAEMECIYGQINFSQLQNAKYSKKKKKN